MLCDSLSQQHSASGCQATSTNAKAVTLNVQKKLFFGDPSMSTVPNGENSSDPYYLEKVTSSGNNNHLRMTINDDADESFQIWGDSCRAGNCGGTGVMSHRFGADGSATHRGSLAVGGAAAVKGRLFFGDTSMTSTPDWGANGSDPYYLEKVMDGANNSHLRLTINDDQDESFQIWGNACAAGNCYGQGVMAHRFGADGSAKHTGPLCVQGVCITGEQLKRIKANANA